MESTSASATRIDVSTNDSSGIATNNYLGAVALALANQEVRQQLQLIIQAYDLLVAGRETEAAGHAAASTGTHAFSFGPFRLVPSQRLLLEDNSKVHIGSRAFDILTTLVERAGDLKCPVLGLYGAKDPFSQKVDAMKAAITAAGKKGDDIIVYPDAAHGFHADYRASYVEADAKDGWSRMLAFFKANGLS